MIYRQTDVSEQRFPCFTEYNEVSKSLRLEHSFRISKIQLLYENNEEVSKTNEPTVISKIFRIISIDFIRGKSFDIYFRPEGATSQNKMPEYQWHN